MCIWTTREEYLAVFIAVQSLVEVDRVVLISFIILPFWLENAYHTLKIVILEQCDPLIGEPYQQHPKKAHPCVRPRRLSHRPSKSGDGSDLWRSCLKRVYKNINKNNFRYILPMCLECAHGSRGRICTKFGTALAVSGIITCDKCFGDRLKDVDSAGGQNLPCPIHKAKLMTSLLTSQLHPIKDGPILSDFLYVSPWTQQY